MAERGRPPIPPEDVAAWQELYLELLAKDKSEVEINAVEGMPSWPTRWAWQEDANFSIRRSIAHKQGVAFALYDAQKKYQDTYERALDDAASPQLVAITDKIGQHARWKASKLDKDTYGEKQTLEHTGANGKPLDITVTFGK